MEENKITLKEEIVAVLKAEGLDAAEEAAVATTKAAFNIIRLVVPKYSLGLGAIINPIIDLIEPKVMAVLDKIDGKDDAGR